MIILNVFLCAAVVAAVVAPLLWAIMTQHRDEPQTVRATRTTAPATRRVPARATRRGRWQLPDPIA